MAEEQSTLDKVIELDKQDQKEDSAISLTAELIKKRDALKTEIETKISNDKELSEASDDKEDKEETDGSDEKTDDKANSSDSDTADKDDTASDKSTDKPDGKTDEPEDADSDMDDLGDLADLASESLTLIRKVSNVDLFKPYKDDVTAKRNYVKSLVGNASKTLAIEEAPIVYTKDKIVESLNNVIQTLTVYQTSAKQMMNSLKPALMGYIEQSTIYSVYYDKEKLSFTGDMVEDKDLLSTLYVDENCNIKDSLRYLYNYNTDILNIDKFILNNELSSIEGSLTTSNFLKEKETSNQYRYKQTLPGFNEVSVNITEYKDYLSTKIDDYSLYTTKEMKLDSYFTLTPMTIRDDDMYKAIIDYYTKIVSNLSLIGDNVNAVISGIDKLISTIKTKVYDLQNDKIQDLTSIGIDDIIKDSVKFKLVLEANLVTISINNKFLVGVNEFLKKTITLK